MPTHGRSLSSGSIDALTMKDDSACLAPRKGRGRWAAEPLSVCLSVCVCARACLCVLGFSDRSSVVRPRAFCVLAAVAQRDGKERSLKDGGACQRGYCCTVVAISIQLLSLTLPSSHPQKKAFILLLKVQYIDELIDSLSKISKGQPRQQLLFFIYLFSFSLSHFPFCPEDRDRIFTAESLIQS